MRKKNLLYTMVIVVLFVLDGSIFQVIKTHWVIREGLRDLIFVSSMMGTIILLAQGKIKEKSLTFHSFIFFVYYAILFATSFYIYGTPLKYPHIILYISGYFIALTFYCVVSEYLQPRRLIRYVNISVCAYVYFHEILARKGMIALGPEGRALSAGTIFLLMIPTLFLMLEFIQTWGVRPLFFLILNLAIILIEGHRTIWVTLIFTSTTILLIYPKYGQKKIGSRFVLTYLSILLALGVVPLVFELLSFSKMESIQHLAERFSEIYTFTKRKGSGSWRLQQYKYYMTYIRRHLYFGTQFKGFEIPALYGMSKDSGHHFHSGYLESLFYHGIWGLFLIYYPIAIYLVNFFRTKLTTDENIIVFAFLASSFVFSLSYRLTYPFFVILGIGLALMKDNNGEEDVIHNHTGS